MSVDLSLPYPELRPGSHHLTLLLRAAIVDDGHGGPWLSLLRTHTTAGTPVYTHHIHTHIVDRHSTRRLVLLTGDEALSFALRQQWTDLANPTLTQLRELSTWACQQFDAAAWSVSYTEWAARMCTGVARFEQEEYAARCRSDARALRWREAERWLSRPEG